MAYYQQPVPGYYNVQITLNNGTGYNYIPFNSLQAAQQDVAAHGHGQILGPQGQTLANGVPAPQMNRGNQAVPPSSTGYWQVFTADGRRSIKYTDPNIALQNLQANPGGRIVGNVGAPPAQWSHMTNTALR